MIENESSSVAYSGNASTTTPYIIDYPFLDTAHIVVTETDAAGLVTTYTEGTDYVVTGTLSGGRYTGGSITTVVAVVATSTVTIKRVTPITQPTDYVEAGPFPAESHESALDRLTMIEQETRRDSSPADSTISATGVGMVAQTVVGTFATRTIAPASASGLAVTNGDGVAGNPTLSVDISTRAAVTSLADTDLIPVRASGVESKMTAANLRLDLADGSYGTREYGAALIVPDQTDACTVGVINHTTASEVIATYSGSVEEAGYLRIVIPGDYNGGAIQMKLYQYDAETGVQSDDVLWKIRYAKATHQASKLDISGSYTDYIETEMLGITYFVLSDPISLGTGYSAGDTLLVELRRDPTDALDTRSAAVGIVQVAIQYPRTAVVTAWT